MEPTVSVIIPSYNRAQMLRDTLECMIAQKTENQFTWEILVVDDGSTDNTPEIIQEAAKKSSVPVRYFQGGGRGYTAALNTGVQEFRGQWLAFFDDDQITHARWLLQLIQAAEDNKAEIVGGPIVLRLAPKVLAGIGPVCRDLFGETPKSGDKRLLGRKYPLPPGGNRLVHRRVFEKIGAFDENISTGGCDRDFLLRAMLEDTPLGWAPKASADHLISEDRISPEHIKWYSLQWGCSFAHIDRNLQGLARTAGLNVARIGQALLINLPLLIWSYLRGNQTEIRDRTALLWRMTGYTRKTLQMLSPMLFSQKSFFAMVEFRQGRKGT